ncbi:probable serine/threonine-protein kinase PBL15 isoform X2 [Daucus carota subsp. sativus]|uniref:probable serine/threonine-protein kinase PBL15 isoform X2 n=1 Tax=Daucus carota subsp. sativus TaxID=79200 RepID=UPI0030838135
MRQRYQISGLQSSCLMGMKTVLPPQFLVPSSTLILSINCRTLQFCLNVPDVDKLKTHIHLKLLMCLSKLANKDAAVNMPSKIARGLAFLHSSTEIGAPIVHRDFKSTNILLNDNYEAKISNFRLAKFMPDGHENCVTATVLGTFGYFDPEYKLVCFLMQLT